MPEYLLPLKLMSDWNDDEIRDYYDSNPNLTILTYAGMLGLSGGELKDILQTDGSAVDKEEEAMAEEMFKEKEENCECGLMENGTWSEELFDKFGCTCD